MHHLSKEDLFPSHFDKMNVASAVRFFSIKTAVGLEKAVALKEISPNALTTAWWIRFICQWFQILSSRYRKNSISVTNKNKKIELLFEFINVVQLVEIGKGWKPLHTGLILSTLSAIQLAEACFLNDFQFVLTSRLTQDALENVFSQIRRKAGLRPSALQAVKALKLICLSQFISDIKNSSYATDSDIYLLNYAKDEFEFLKEKKALEPVPIPEVSDLSLQDLT
ncbi:Transposable element P transposase, partial [Stegodyphus mimosarum]